MNVNEIIKKLKFNKKLIIIHLGKNPIKGGKPPNDKKLIIIEILIKKFIFIKNN